MNLKVAFGFYTESLEFVRIHNTRNLFCVLGQIQAQYVSTGPYAICRMAERTFRRPGFWIKQVPSRISTQTSKIRMSDVAPRIKTNMNWSALKFSCFVGLFF